MQRPCLARAEPSVRRAEQVAVYVLPGLGHIAQVAAACQPESADMVHGVVAYAVSAAHHFLVDLWMLAHVVAHHEEGGLDAVSVQHVEHPGCDLGDGSVVEGEVHRVLVPRFMSPEQSAGDREPEAYRGAFYQHGL